MSEGLGASRRWLQCYGKSAVTRRVGCALEQIGAPAEVVELPRAVPMQGTKPLDPTKPAKGKTQPLGPDRKPLLTTRADMKILKSRIQRAAKDGRVSQLVVERDYAQSDVLLGIARQPSCASRWCSRAGTALKKMHLKSYPCLEVSSRP